MPELAAAVVQQYTKGRLVATDAETIRLLAERLDKALIAGRRRRDPVREEDELTIDRPGGRLLRLPTFRLIELVEVTENGVAIDVADLYVSPLGMVTKKSGGYWANNLGAITVKMTHGYDSAPDFDGAVLSSIDRASFASSGGRPRVVGPFQYETDGTDSERAILDLYRLERAP